MDNEYYFATVDDGSFVQCGLTKTSTDSSPAFERDFLDSLCYIFKGARIKYGSTRTLYYDYKETILGGCKLIKSPTIINETEFFKEYLKDYPQDFELILEKPQPPTHSETKRLSHGSMCISKHATYYVNVPSEYSNNRFKELNKMFLPHTKMINDMIINSDLINNFRANSEETRLFFSIMKSGIYFREGGVYDMNSSPKKLLCRFWDYGMEELPNKIDVLTAFANALINQLFDLYPIEKEYKAKIVTTLIMNSGMHSNNRECYVCVRLTKINTSEPVPKGLNKW